MKDVEKDFISLAQAMSEDKKVTGASGRRARPLRGCVCARTESCLRRAVNQVKQPQRHVRQCCNSW